MTVKKRLEKIEAQRGAATAHEPLIVKWADGQVIAVLDHNGARKVIAGADHDDTKTT